MKCLDRFMSLLGYVPRAAIAASVPALKIEIDSSQIRENLEMLEKLATAAKDAEAALAKLWNIQAAMQYRAPYTGSGGAGGVSGSSGSASAPRRPGPD